MDLYKELKRLYAARKELDARLATREWVGAHRDAAYKERRLINYKILRLREQLGIAY